MMQVDPVLLGILLGAALVCFLSHLLQFASELLCGTYPCHVLRIFEVLGAVWCAAVFSVILILMTDGLTFSPDVLLPMRWSVLIGVLLGLITAFRSHDWLSLLSCMPFILTVPFFEAAFGILFPWVLLCMLLLSAMNGVYRTVRSFRSYTELPGPDAVTDALESLDAGILFTDGKGKVLLKNRIMDGLCFSICREKLKNGQRFWEKLNEFRSTELVTKVSGEESCLFRFAEGYTWSLFREFSELDGKEIVQYLALNVTDSDKVRRTTLRKRGEAAQLKEHAADVTELLAELEAAKEEKDALVQNLNGLLRTASRKGGLLKENPSPDKEGFDLLLDRSTE